MASLRWSDSQRSAFAVRMRIARDHSGLTQKDAAEQIGIKQGTLSELEKTATKSAHTARAAQVYKVSAAWLQDGSGTMLPSTTTFSPRAAFVAARLDEIADPAEFDRACVLCETFATLAKAGSLATVASLLALAAPAPEPTAGKPRGRSKQTGVDPKAPS